MLLEEFFAVFGKTARNFKWRLESRNRKKTFIVGIREDFEYDPMTAVAREWTHNYFSRSQWECAVKALSMDARTAVQIRRAIYQWPGYRKDIRIRLLKLCGISRHFA